MDGLEYIFMPDLLLLHIITNILRHNATEYLLNIVVLNVCHTSICTRLQVGDVTVAEFLCQLQKITTFPVRSFVLPLLQSSVPRLRDRLKRWLIE